MLFLKLELKVAGNVVKDIFYCLENDKGNCLDFSDLDTVGIKVKVFDSKQNAYCMAKIKLYNKSKNISLLYNIKIEGRVTVDVILTVFYDDDYVSLLLGEVKIINIEKEKQHQAN